MGCESCKSKEKDPVTQAAETGRVMSDMMQKYDAQNRRLWVAVLALCGAVVIMAGCMVWAIQNAQRIANEAVLEALYSVSEIGVTEETTTTTTTTQTVEGDSAIINNSDFEQYNDNSVKAGGS